MCTLVPSPSASVPGGPRPACQPGCGHTLGLLPPQAQGRGFRTCPRGPLWKQPGAFWLLGSGWGWGRAVEAGAVTDAGQCRGSWTIWGEGGEGWQCALQPEPWVLSPAVCDLSYVPEPLRASISPFLMCRGELDEI